MCDGRCLQECRCSYFRGSEDCNCSAGTHSHYVTNRFRFCRTNCNYNCQLKRCKTFSYCGDALPERYYQNKSLTTGEQCNYCGIFKVKYPNVFGNCFICHDDKYLIETDCCHEFCLDCLMQINPDKDDNPCPICRKTIELNDV